MEKIIFETEVGKGTVEYVMYIKKNIKKSRAGSISIFTDKDSEDYLFISSSLIECRFREKGYGKKLYTHALKKLGCIKTNYHNASVNAQYVWQSLCKSFRNKKDFFKGVITLYNKPK